MIGFLVSGYKSNLYIYSGAILTGILCQFIISYVSKKSKIKKDSITAITLTTMFALGLVLNKFILDSSLYTNKSGLGHFIFGQAASIQRADVYFVLIVSSIVLTIVLFFGRALKLQAFDPIHFALTGWPKNLIQFAFDLAITLTVVIGIQSVGVVMMSALIISPAIFAKALTNSFRKMLTFAIVINLICVCVGTYISLLLENPTGPWIIIVLSISCFVALAMGSKIFKTIR